MEKEREREDVTPPKQLCAYPVGKSGDGVLTASKRLFQTLSKLVLLLQTCFGENLQRRRKNTLLGRHHLIRRYNAVFLLRRDKNSQRNNSVLSVTVLLNES